jgi:murein tripeptide amidase MpaA
MRKHLIQLSATVFLAILLVMSTRSAEMLPTLVTLKTANPHIDAHQLESLGFDIAGVSRSKGQIQIVSKSGDFLTKTLSTFFGPNEIQISARELSQPYEDYSPESSYPNYDQTLATLRQMAAENSANAHLFNLNELLGTPLSQEGRAIWALHVSSDPAIIEDRPKVVFIGQHHARELMTHQAVLDTARDLLSNTPSNPQYKRAIASYSFWFVPIVNPDGLSYVFEHDRMWRKNRSLNSKSGYRGVDLNRNYDFKWGACGSNSNSPASNIYKGGSASSEPEVQTLDRLNELLKTQLLISYHSSGNEVLYPYVCGDTAERGIYFDLRDKIAQATQFGQRHASSSGEDFEHHYAQHGSLSFLLEIGEEFQPPLATYKQDVWPRIQKVLPLLITTLESSAWLSLNIVGSDDGQPIEGANLTIDEVSFTENEQRLTDQFGRIRWKLSPNSYHIRVWKNGYVSQQITISVGGQGLIQVVTLHPNLTEQHQSL